MSTPPPPPVDRDELFRRVSDAGERLCAHGIGHPDLDPATRAQAEALRVAPVHACCGIECCTRE